MPCSSRMIESEKPVDYKRIRANGKKARDEADERQKKHSRNNRKLEKKKRVAR